MRFRYFDAQGNEVSLSTAAALAVKIELGEVTESTLLYDAACDEWAPAGEQEIYRHILEHGSSSAEPDPAEDPDPEREVGRPTAPPLEDFWGPAMSTGENERSAGEAPPFFDLSLEHPSSDTGASGRDHPPEEILEGLSLKASGEEHEEDVTEPAGDARAEPAEPAEPADADAPAGAAGAGSDARGGSVEHPGDASGEDPGGPAVEDPVERPSAAAAGPARGDVSPGTRRGKGSARSRDPSLAKLEAIAREATARMEQEEALRKKGRGPSLADRVAEGAREGGRRTGEALKSGAAASARALSEGGKATAETVGAGVRAMGRRARKAGPRLREAMGVAARVLKGTASGLTGAWRGAGRRVASATGATGRGVGAAVSAAASALGAAGGFAWRVARTVVMAPVRGVAATLRTLVPVSRRTGRKVRGAFSRGMRRLPRAMASPLVLGVAVFAATFSLVRFGGGREAGEDLWQATVGIARSVAAETAAADAAANAAANGADAAGEGEAGNPDATGTAGEAATPGPASGDVGGGGDDPLPAAAGAASDETASDEAASPEAAPGEIAPGETAPGEAAPSDTAPAAPVPTAGAAEALLAEFEEELALASERALEDMIAAMDSVERAFQLPEAPPEEWLGGYYLSHASEFHEVRQYWARYRGYIRAVKARDGVLYRRAVETRLAELGVPRERILELTRVAEDRFREGRVRRDSLYDAMADVAEAAVDLHDFLTENQAAIEYDPVRPGRVSRAPVLEAYPSTPEVKAEMDARLDRILGTMERVHGLKPVFTRELQNVLFTSLQAVETVDTFRLRPRDAPPGSGAPPPGG